MLDKTPDNYELWEAHDRERERWLSLCPVCEKCGHPIQDEFYFYIDNEILCEECMQDKYMYRTEDFGV